MIDFNDMKRRQENGLAKLNSLDDDEMQVLRHYCSLTTEVLMTIGQEGHKTTDQIVINAIRTGIGLGLMIKVENGEVK